MKSFLTTIQGSILLGSLIISLSILISSGVIRVNGIALNKGSLSAAQVPTQIAPNPSSGPTKLEGITAGKYPILGNKNAKVLLVEWGDFQCPFCEKWFQNVKPNLIKDYVNNGKVAFAFRDFAFLGQESTDAANAARCANEQGKFWDYHDYLYSHQGQENSGAFSKDNLKKFASDTGGLNTDQFNLCVDSNKYAKDIADDIDAGKKAQVTGTPTVYINGIQLVGAQPYSAFRTVIDDQLSK